MSLPEIFYLASDVVGELLRMGETTIATTHGLKIAVEQGRMPMPSLLSPRGVRGWTPDDLDATKTAMRRLLRERRRERERYLEPRQLELRRELQEVG